MKKVVIFLGLVLFAFALFHFFPKHLQTPPVLSIAPLVSESATTTYTNMHLSYPQSSQTHLPEIFAYVEGAKSDFIKDYASITDSDAKNMFMRLDAPYEIFMTTKVATSSKTVSYIIETYEYTGGAHGNTAVSTFTYDAWDDLVTIDNVLSGQYLPQLSTISRDYLYTFEGVYAQKEMLESGTEPKVENFSSWYLTDNAITFIFGQYQVGPYVLGIVEMPVEKSKLGTFLNQTFK